MKPIQINYPNTDCGLKASKKNPKIKFKADSYITYTWLRGIVLT